MSALETFKAGELFQIAFIVRDLDAALERYSTMLNAGPWRCWTLHAENHTDEQYMGGPTDYVTRLALTSGDERSSSSSSSRSRAGASTRTGERPRRGLSSPRVIVDSVADTIAEMAEAGYPVIQGCTGFGDSGDGVYAYFDTRRELGTIVEALEPPTRMPDPEFVWDV